jgi:hypothetical protein
MRAVLSVTQATLSVIAEGANGLRRHERRARPDMLGQNAPREAQTMSDSDADDRQPAGAALLERLQAQLSGRFRADPALFRVVEITRDSRGRLVRQGQIWHSDLDRVRRFGRAVAANSVSQRVVIADAAGAVVEQIPVTGGDEPAGWSGDWQALPLPPAPPRKKPKPAPGRLPGGAQPPAGAAPAYALPPPEARGARPTAELPVVQVEHAPSAPPSTPTPPASAAAAAAASVEVPSIGDPVTGDVAIVLP